MSNEEQKNIGSVLDDRADVDKSKRKFSKAGLVAPVIMTLASKPVFAVQGLSNMISGNGSNCRGDNFQGGFTQGYWKMPNDNNGSKAVWATAIAHLTGKTFETATISDAFAGHAFPPSTQGADRLLDVVGKTGMPAESAIVAGYLNLYYYLNAGTAGSYFMTEQQFWALNDNDTTTWIVPGNQTFAALIEKYMDGEAGDTCM